MWKKVCALGEFVLYVGRWIGDAQVENVDGGVVSDLVGRGFWVKL